MQTRAFFSPNHSTQADVIPNGVQPVDHLAKTDALQAPQGPMTRARARSVRKNVQAFVQEVRDKVEPCQAFAHDSPSVPTFITHLQVSNK